MRTLIQLSTFTVWIVLFGCDRHPKGAKYTSVEDSTRIYEKLPDPIDTPRSFVKNYGANENNRLFAFVGQKIWVQPLPSQQYSFDNGFKAKYLILEKVFGSFSGDTIEFVAYDHYGIPPFSEFKNVLVYVSADSGTYYHQKYTYSDVYRTVEGHWAGAYAWDDYDHDYNKRTKIKPVKINFEELVLYPINKMIVDDDGKDLTLSGSFPKPYFRTIGDSAVVVYGNYVEDLFALKRDGYLTARNIFKNGKLIQ